MTAPLRYQTFVTKQIPQSGRGPLPDGKTFQSAGRLEFVARGGLFALTPDTGHSGDVAAFCAALA